MSDTLHLYDAQGRRLYLSAAERDAFLEAATQADRPIRTLCKVACSPAERHQPATLCQAARSTSGWWSSPERREPLSMGRLSHACLPHTTLGVCRTTPLRHPSSVSTCFPPDTVAHDAVMSPSLHHLVPLAFPCWDNSRLRCSTLRQAGGDGAPAISAYTKLQRRRPMMDIAVAQQCRGVRSRPLLLWSRSSLAPRQSSASSRRR